MPGLEPGIQAAPSLVITATSALDARVKPLHDEGTGVALPFGGRLREPQRAALAPLLRHCTKFAPMPTLLTVLAAAAASAVAIFRWRCASSVGASAFAPGAFGGQCTCTGRPIVCCWRASIAVRS